MESTRLIDIYKHLKKDGFDVYFPAQKAGECKAPYVVVKESGTTQYLDFSSAAVLYDLLCYVPKSKYSELQPFVTRVKESMKGLWPMITPMNYEVPSFYDDTVDAHMISVQYRNIKYTPKGGSNT